MKNKIIADIESAEMEKGPSVPSFSPGDTVRVHNKVVEGAGKERIQVYEGVCIARKDDGANSSFTVRKISFGEGVERVFPLYSPRVAKIEVSRKGKVRRSKLYYLRDRSGKSARIAEDNSDMLKAKAEKLAAKAEADSAE